MSGGQQRGGTLPRLTALLENEIRLAVYRHFYVQGRAPMVVEVAGVLGVSVESVREAFVSLAAQHVLVLHPGTDEVWMAMPFSAAETAFKVVTDEGKWWANCAWDALGIPAMLGQDAEIYSTCPASGIPLRVTVTGKELGVDTASVVHFLLPAARWWDDIGYT
jgi:hypothetical protein